MLRDVRLRFLPNVPTCLSWSPDGQLAVAGSEYVLILLVDPRTNQFHHARASVRELILGAMDKEVQPADAEIYSIGDEQGPGYAKELAWSPLGLSKYRRCILGVLTTNHQIKIFEPKDDPWSDWNMTHDLTGYMIDYTGWKNQSSDETVMRLRSRTRSFAWSPACCHRRWGESLIAAANDNLEVLFLRITHVHISIVENFKAVGDVEIVKRPGMGATWVSKLAWGPWKKQVTPEEDKGRGKARGRGRGKGKGKGRVEIKNKRKSKSRAFLAYGFRGEVFVCPITMCLNSGDGKGSPADQEDGDELTVVAGTPYVVGRSISDVHPVSAISWAEEEIGGCFILAYAVPTCVKVIAMNHDGEVMSTGEFRNGFVEPVTGICFTPSTSPLRVMLHIITSSGRTQIIDYTPQSDNTSDKSTSHTSDATDEPEVLLTNAPPWSTEEEEELRAIASRWTNVLADRRQDYLAEHDLFSCESRVYGIAVSPLGGVIAVACSFHPKDSLEYITASNEMTRIVFGTHEALQGVLQRRGFLAEPPSDQPRVPTPLDISGEAFLVDMQCFGGRNGKIVGDIWRSLDGARFADGGWDLKNTSILSDEVRDSLALSILAKRQLNALRYKCCLETLPKNPSPANFRLSLVEPPPRENPEIIAHIIANVLAAPRNELTARSRLSVRIIYSLACIGILGLYDSRHVVGLAWRAFRWLSGQEEEDLPGGDADASVEISMDVSTELSISERRISDLDVIERGDDDGSGLQEIRDKDKSFASRLEKCTLCGEGMKWTDLRMAECSEGHRFPRCTLTFLPITDPTLTKVCMVCARTALVERALDDDEGEMNAGDGAGFDSGGRGGGGSSTLARSVLTGLDVCVHCGGRYWAKGS